MRRPPQGRGAALIDARGLGLILAFGFYGGLAALWLYGALLAGGEAEARSAAFTALVAIELVTALAFRSLTSPVLVLRPLANPMLFAAVGLAGLLQLLALTWPPLRTLLGTAMPQPGTWVLIAALLIPLGVLPEAAKLIAHCGAPRPAGCAVPLEPGRETPEPAAGSDQP